jgi:hypothetical protein
MTLLAGRPDLLVHRSTRRSRTEDFSDRSLVGYDGWMDMQVVLVVCF